MNLLKFNEFCSRRINDTHFNLLQTIIRLSIDILALAVNSSFRF